LPVTKFDLEQHDDVARKVFYVVAPDGGDYRFGGAAASASI
jgi:hypothetical protein